MPENTQLATKPKQNTGIATYLGGDAVRKNIAGVIGEKNVTRFVSSVVSAVQANPALAKCSNASILSAALQGEALQLPPSPQLGMFYIVPYKNKKKVGNQWVDVDEAQYQIGWKGYLQLAIRSGQYKNIVVSEIKEGEVEYNPITEEMDIHPITDPAVREAAKTVGYYAMFELMNGFKKQLFSPVESIQAHAKKYSRGYRYDLEKGKSTSPWSTNFDAMAKKTMIRQLIGKWGIMSVEMQQAYVADQSVIDEDGTVRYVDNPHTVDVEVQVAEDIAKNANSEDFVETAAEEAPKPKKGRKPAQKQTETVVTGPIVTGEVETVIPEDPKPLTEEKATAPETEPETLDFIDADTDEEPDWG